MFGHNTIDEVTSYDDYPAELIIPDGAAAAAQPLYLPPLAIPTGYATSSGCSSYGGSPNSTTSYGGGDQAYNIQRSISSHSLHKNTNTELHSYHNFEADSSSHVRKALSTGDLLGTNVAQHSQRSSIANESSIIESMNRAASPYSPEEKRERIERYRSKRNLRNFNKKIKYECRKTLADSRPRIRGRFARNDELDKTSAPQWDNNTHVEEEDELHDNVDDENWMTFIDAFSANLIP